MSGKAIVIGSLLTVAAGLGVYLYLRKKKAAKAAAAAPASTAAAAGVPGSAPAAVIAPAGNSSPSPAPAQAVLSDAELAAIVEEQNKQHYCSLPMGSPFMTWASQPDTKIGYVQKMYGIQPPQMFGSPTGFPAAGGNDAYMRVAQLDQQYGCA